MAGMHIVGIGGTLRPGSSGAKALAFCLERARARGARVTKFAGEDLRAPLFEPGAPLPEGSISRLIAALRDADGVIIASPGYHGSISGTLKNVLDYLEEMAGDPTPYFDGRAVGCIASAGGWQASVTTLGALRAIVHALRGWPTPLGVALNSNGPLFDPEGRCATPELARSLECMTDQVVEFARMRAAQPALAGAA